jgi:hypothetical protein
MFFASHALNIYERINRFEKNFTERINNTFCDESLAGMT